MNKTIITGNEMYELLHKLPTTLRLRTSEKKFQEKRRYTWNEKRKFENCARKLKKSAIKVSKNPILLDFVN